MRDIRMKPTREFSRRMSQAASAPGVAPEPAPRRRLRRVGFVLLLVVALGISGAAYYYYSRFSQPKLDPQRSAELEIAAVVERVGRLMILPEGETPTVATVTDPDKLRDQAFFAKAKTGDKVVIYTNAKKAILYDPIADKIIEVAPLNIGNQQ